MNDGRVSWNWITYTATAVTIAATLIMLYRFIPTTAVFPIADEWVYVKPMMSNSLSTFLQFVIGAHGDHRVPFQKLLQALLLRTSGFDFRALTAFNGMLAAVVSMLLIVTAKNYRGRSSIGDLLIPAIAVNFCTPFTWAGFDMQILTGTLTMAVFAYAMVNYSHDRRGSHMVLALASLILCAWCGLNGAATSLACCALIGYWMWRNRPRIARAWWFLLAVAIASCIAQVAFWLLSKEPTAHEFGLRTFLGFVVGTITSNLFMWAADGRLWKFAALMVLIVAGLLVLARQIRKNGLDVAAVAFGGPILGAMGMVLVLAVGRSNLPWDSNYDVHYGYAAIMLPILAWVLVSVAVAPVARGAIGVALVVFYAASFQMNFAFRLSVNAISGPQYRSIQRDLASQMPAREVADKYIASLSYPFWTNEAARKFTADRIEMLRQHGGWQYR